MSATSTPCVLIVADPGRIAELASALDVPVPHGADVHVSSGGDDTIDLFAARKPEVVILTASLELGDTSSLIETLRKMVPRAEVQIIVVGDDTGPIRTALDAIDIAPDRFVSRPLSTKALRFAVEKSLEVVSLVRGQPLPGVITAPPSAITLSRVKVTAGTDPAVHPSVDPATAGPVDDAPTAATRAALRARWEALADSIGDAAEPDEIAPEPSEEAAPLPPPILIQPRRRTNNDVEAGQHWRPGNTAEIREDWTDTAPVREPTLIIRDEAPAPSESPAEPSVAARTKSDEQWSEPVPLSALADRDSSRDLVEPVKNELEDFEDDIIIGHGNALETTGTPLPHVIRGGEVVRIEDTPAPSAHREAGGRDFARQLRAKMSMMAQRLFQNDSASSPAVDVGPRHDHQTEIDLASLGEEPALGGGGAGVTEIERSGRTDAREHTTSPGSWDTQVRERGLPEAGEVVRGVSDTAMLLAKMFATGATGRIVFRRDEGEKGTVEKIVSFDQGRPVFAASNEPGDRMGELLTREGKITAAQYERCQSVVAASGRRMGEILVDFGYLKRRELLPAVRRHVEDIVYSLFGWDRGQYQIVIEPNPSAERIRLSRHPASLVLEGVRRKLDRTSLERLVGPPSTVIEVPDRERLGGILNMGDLTPEERACLAAFDGQADLSQVARAASLDVTDLLPFAWGLCALGLATARRAEIEAVEESSALVGETDLAIDRERVRGRWQLVTEADYFALLGVRRDATGFEIRRAYQAARRDFAADCFPADLRRELALELEDIANVLDEAFRVLRDDRLRLTYLENLFE
ncbi:MAG: response regulator receiver protein [Myxococcales bacterium]|nr:response regulator receiver protein [Myxococcales bacterium]